MPRRASAYVGTAPRARPSKRTLPLPGFSSPITVLMSVVLPAPLRPMRPVIEPAASSSDTPRRMCTEAIDTLRLLRLSTRTPHHMPLYFGILQRDGRRRVGDDAPIVEGDHALREAAHH